MTWTCPRCNRKFRQANQRHACGVGSSGAVLRDRPPAIVDLYRTLEATVRGLGALEVVARDRYVLFRTTRIFTDLTVTKDALRVVIHLDRKVTAPYFVKVGRSGKRVSHVALIRTGSELRAITPLLREAYRLAAGEEPAIVSRSTFQDAALSENPMPRKKSSAGVHEHFHKDGSLWARGELKAGVMEGYWEWFRKDGSLMRTGSFARGVQVGDWTTYAKDGRLVKVTTMKPAAGRPAAGAKKGSK